jgi:ABC-type sugar transport system ATPase subunit
MIELQRVSLRAGNFALHDISLRVESGEYAVLMGRTGRGKTTLLEAICGLRKVESGRIVLHGDDVTDWSPADREIGYVPQDLALFPTLTVRQHLEFAVRLRKSPPAVIRQRVDEMSALLGITPLLERHVQGLSGGESQRVALGRALSFHPAVLLLDEPLSALDEATRGEMYALLRSIRERTGVTVLHVTHSRQEAAALADRLLLLEDGRIREDGRPPQGS